MASSSSTPKSPRQLECVTDEQRGAFPWQIECVAEACREDFPEEGICVPKSGALVAFLGTSILSLAPWRMPKYSCWFKSAIALAESPKCNRVLCVGDEQSIFMVLHIEFPDCVPLSLVYRTYALSEETPEGIEFLAYCLEIIWNKFPEGRWNGSVFVSSSYQWHDQFPAQVASLREYGLELAMLDDAMYYVGDNVLEPLSIKRETNQRGHVCISLTALPFIRVRDVGEVFATMSEDSRISQDRQMQMVQEIKHWKKSGGTIRFLSPWIYRSLIKHLCTFPLVDAFLNNRKDKAMSNSDLACLDMLPDLVLE